MGRRNPGWLIGALVVLAAGCGGGDGETRTATVEPTPTASAEATAAPEATATPATDGEAAAIVETRGTIDGGRVRFLLTELRRSGPTVILNARLELADPEESPRLYVTDTFDDGIGQELDRGENEGHTVFDGVAMVDPEGRKKYLVARDETGRCVCTNNLGSIDAEAPIDVTATLTAPPETVTQVDLLVPHFRTLRAVPLSE